MYTYEDEGIPHRRTALNPCKPPRAGLGCKPSPDTPHPERSSPLAHPHTACGCGGSGAGGGSLFLLCPHHPDPRQQLKRPFSPLQGVNLSLHLEAGGD